MVAFSLGFLSATFLALPIIFFIHRRGARRLVECRMESEAKFQMMIDKFNHEGSIPMSASAGGLTSLITSGIIRTIKNLQLLLERQEWDTTFVIIELQQIVTNELMLLFKKLEEFLVSRRKILKDHEKDQGL